MRFRRRNKLSEQNASGGGGAISTRSIRYNTVLCCIHDEHDVTQHPHPHQQQQQVAFSRVSAVISPRAYVSACVLRTLFAPHAASHAAAARKPISPAPPGARRRRIFSLPAFVVLGTTRLLPPPPDSAAAATTDGGGWRRHGKTAALAAGDATYCRTFQSL